MKKTDIILGLFFYSVGLISVYLGLSFLIGATTLFFHISDIPANNFNLKVFFLASFSLFFFCSLFFFFTIKGLKMFFGGLNIILDKEQKP